MASILQQEIDQLLDASSTKSTEPENYHPGCDSRKIRIYDFKRPDIFSKDQIRTMSILHEDFARNATFIFTNKFKMPCCIQVVSVYQLTYGEFIRSVRIPTAIGAVSIDKPFSHQIVFEIDSMISFAFINRAFGVNDHNITPQHELTRLEWVVVKDVFEKLIDCLKQSWKFIVPDFKAVIHHVDTNPQFINIASPSDMTVLIVMEVKVGDVDGEITINYPYDCLLGVMERLSIQFWYSRNKVLVYNKKNKLIDRMDIPVEIVAEIFCRDYSLETIFSWKKDELLLPLVPQVSNICFLKFGDQRVFECLMVKNIKQFPKKVLIKNIVKNPYMMERKMKIEAVNPQVVNALAKAGITISVELGQTVKTVNDILKMGEGTIVELDKLTGDLVDIKANGVLIAKGEVVVIDENFGVRVIEIASTLEPLDGKSGENVGADE